MKISRLSDDLGEHFYVVLFFCSEPGRITAEIEIDDCANFAVEEGIKHELVHVSRTILIIAEELETEMRERWMALEDLTEELSQLSLSFITQHVHSNQSEMVKFGTGLAKPSHNLSFKGLASRSESIENELFETLIRELC